MIKWDYAGDDYNNLDIYQFTTLENYADGSYVVIKYNMYITDKWSVNWPTVLKKIYYKLYPFSSDNMRFPYNFNFSEVESFKIHIEEEYFRMRKLVIFT